MDCIKIDTESSFSFKQWMQECSFNASQAARELSIPMGLVSCYLEEDSKVPLERVDKCHKILEDIKKKKQQEKIDTIAERLNQSKEYQECLNDLLVCLNRDKKKATFWPVYDKTYFHSSDPYMMGDVHGVRTLSKKVVNEFNENPFQPHTFTGNQLISQFYVIEFLPFDDDDKKWSDEEFYKYSLSTRYFQDKKKKLAERAIVYIFGNNIDAIIEKVNKE